VIELKTESSQGSHSAPFPRALVEFFVKAFSDAGDIVYDPFLGSGSTMAAAHVLGRNGYGCEILAGILRCDPAPDEGTDGQRAGAASELQPVLGRLVTIEGSTSLQMGEVRAKILKAGRSSGTGGCLVVFDYLQRAAVTQAMRRFGATSRRLQDSHSHAI